MTPESIVQTPNVAAKVAVSSRIGAHRLFSQRVFYPRLWSDRLVLFLVLGVVVVNALLWLFSIPFQHGPDEGAHFQVVRFIRDYGRLPVFDPGELWLIRTQSGAVETYAAFPPLAYVVAALAMKPFPDHALWMARLVSLAACGGSAALTFLITRQLLPDRRPVAVTAALVVGLLPQVAFTAAYVNNDALAVLESALLYYLLVLTWRTEPRIPFYLATGLTAGAMLLTKYTFYPAALVGFGAALYMVRDLRRYWLSALALVVALAACSSWWFIRNWQLYGELIPSKTVAAAKASAGGNTLFVPVDHGINLLTISTQTDFWAVTLRSFVATFGFLSIYVDGPYYVACLVVALLGILGVVVHLRKERATAGRKLVGVGAFAVLLTSVLGAMAVSTYGEYSPQGRYLFAALVPIAIALAVGWHALADSHRLVGWLPAGAVLGLGALSLVSLLGYVVPRDFGLVEERIIVEIDRPSQPQSSGSEIEVLGWSLAQGSTVWRPFSPDVVDRYRRPASGILIYLNGPPGQGAFQGTAQYGFRRRDVSEFYGGNRRLDPIGYRYVLPPGALPPGEHRLYACALAPTLQVPVCAVRVVEVT